MIEQRDEEPKIKILQISLYALIFIAALIFTFIVGNWIDEILEIPKFPPPPWNIISGFTVFFSGLVLGIKSTRLLYNGGKGLLWSELVYKSQSRELVVDGTYAYTRNPMVLGYSMLPCGMGLLLGSLGMTIFIPAIIVIINVLWVKYKEEPVLERRFSSRYQEYKEETPFLIPRPWKILVSSFPGRMGEASINLYALSNIIISLSGLVLLYALPFNPDLSVVQASQLSWITGILYIIICIAGVFAGIYPSKISGLSHSNGGHRNTKPNGSNYMGFKGHHPDCEEFENHVLLLTGRALCAGCTGLCLGAVLSVLGMLIYLVYGLVFGIGLHLFWIGFVLVYIGIIQHHLGFENAYIHAIINVLFVTGTLFLYIGVDQLKRGIVEFYLLGLIIFWINARIVLSQADHIRVCRRCKIEDCEAGYG